LPISCQEPLEIALNKPLNIERLDTFAVEAEAGSEREISLGVWRAGSSI
jgi:hypothetical protein